MDSLHSVFYNLGSIFNEYLPSCECAHLVRLELMRAGSIKTLKIDWGNDDLNMLTELRDLEIKFLLDTSMIASLRLENLSVHNIIGPLSSLNVERLKTFKCIGSQQIPLDFLHNAPLQSLTLYSFDGSLKPLRDTPLHSLQISRFTGTLEPLRGAPLQTLILDDFDGSLEPLRGAPLQYLHLDSFTGSLEPLRGAPLQYLRLYSFNGSLEPLRGAPLQSLCLDNFTGSLEPLRGAPLQNLHLDCFTGLLEPLLETPLQIIKPDSLARAFWKLCE